MSIDAYVAAVRSGGCGTSEIGAACVCCGFARQVIAKHYEHADALQRWLQENDDGRRAGKDVVAAALEIADERGRLLQTVRGALAEEIRRTGNVTYIPLVRAIAAALGEHV